MGKNRKRNKRGPKPPPPLKSPPKPSQDRPQKVAISFARIVEGKLGCLSHCGAADVRKAMKCLRLASEQDWISLFKSSLDVKSIPDHSRPGFPRPPWLSEDVKIYEMDAGEKHRVFWYRTGYVMNVLWFDPGHDGTGR